MQSRERITGRIHICQCTACSLKKGLQVKYIFSLYRKYIMQTEKILYLDYCTMYIFCYLMYDYTIYSMQSKARLACESKTVWRIQNVLMRFRIPLFKLMRIQIFFSKGDKFFSNLHFILLHNLTKLAMCNFLGNNAGGEAME